MAQVFCFGDSITYGAWDESQAGWVQRLRLALDIRMRLEGKYSLTYNLGIPGETTEGLKQRFTAETMARIENKKGEEPVFIFSFGANDAAFIPSQGKFRVDKEKYTENYQAVFEEAKKLSDKILVLNILPVVESAAANPPGKDKSRRNEWMASYNEKLVEVSTENAIKIVGVYSAFLKAGHEKLFSKDGVHPNALSHEMLFKSVYPALIELIEN